MESLASQERYVRIDKQTAIHDRGCGPRGIDTERSYRERYRLVLSYSTKKSPDKPQSVGADFTSEEEMAYFPLWLKALFTRKGIAWYPIEPLMRISTAGFFAPQLNSMR